MICPAELVTPVGAAVWAHIVDAGGVGGEEMLEDAFSHDLARRTAGPGFVVADLEHVEGGSDGEAEVGGDGLAIGTEGIEPEATTFGGVVCEQGVELACFRVVRDGGTVASFPSAGLDAIELFQSKIEVGPRGVFFKGDRSELVEPGLGAFDLRAKVGAEAGEVCFPGTAEHDDGVLDIAGDLRLQVQALRASHEQRKDVGVVEDMG